MVVGLHFLSEVVVQEVVVEVMACRWQGPGVEVLLQAEVVAPR